MCAFIYGLVSVYKSMAGPAALTASVSGNEEESLNTAAYRDHTLPPPRPYITASYRRRAAGRILVGRLSLVELRTADRSTAEHLP